LSPTLTVFYVFGSISTSGISLADAKLSSDVFVAAIASVAGVEESTVEVTGFSVAEARRRRLLEDEAVLTVDYKISAAAGQEEAIVQTMSLVSPAEMTETLTTKSEAAGASAAFAEVSVDSLEEPTISTSNSPTGRPSVSPTVFPTAVPTKSPTVSPTFKPSVSPTISTATPGPSVAPGLPTASPIFSPTRLPTPLS